eukprot:1180236-Amphidinium_carterae.1
MVLVAKGQHIAVSLCQAYRRVHRKTADDFQGSQQADVLANQGLCDEGVPLLEAGWTATS